MTRTSVVGLLAVLLTACSEKPQPQPMAVEYPAADSAGAVLLISRCGLCHVAPLPAAHVAGAWSTVVNRMQMRMRSRGYSVLADEEQRVLLDYLQAHAAPAEK